jgi:hypothetical protein
MNHNGKWDTRQWQRIEEEYQEPAREVVRVFYDEMRVPLCQIAEMLYISEATLRKWFKIWGIETRLGGYIKKETPGKVQLRARLLGYENVGQAIADMRASDLSWDDIQLKLKCSDSTISKYIPEAAKGRYILTEAGREAKQETARQLNKKMESNEIKRGGFAKVPLEMVTPIYR